MHAREFGFFFLYLMWHAALCRKVVIQLLRGRGPKAVLKKADVLEASKRELGRAINSNEYSKVGQYVI